MLPTPGLDALGAGIGPAPPVAKADAQPFNGGVTAAQRPLLPRAGIRHPFHQHNAAGACDRGELGDRGIRMQGCGQGSNREHQRVHHGELREPLLQQLPQALFLAAGTHHEIRIRVEQPHLQGGFQIHLAVLAEQQHCLATLDTCPLQHRRLPHVPQHDATFDIPLQFRAAPLRRM